MAANTNSTQSSSSAAIGRSVILAESEALRSIADSIDDAAFEKAIELLLNCKSQIVVTGVGKSGHIAAKVAATLASTGSAAFFLHAAEAAHGDLGMITAGNVVLAISRSGSTEILTILPYLTKLSVPLIAITAHQDSALAKAATVALITRVEKEACPFNLAPTSSTTAQLAVGDALAVALMYRRGFTPEDFAIRHPLGALGKRLLLHVRDVMHREEGIPLVHTSTPLQETITKISDKRLGAVLVSDDEGKLAGIFTDGDLRRYFERVAGNLDIKIPVGELMIRNPKNCLPDIPAVKAVDLMETYKITVLPVVDDCHRIVGIVHLHDLLQSGLGS